MSRFFNVGAGAALLLVLAASAQAGTPNDFRVPELDGGLAFLALGLTAAIIAIVREKHRS